MTDAFERQLLELAWEEIQLRKKRKRRGVFVPLQDKIYDFIPPPVIRALESAFRGAFQFVFHRGGAVINLSLGKKKPRAGDASAPPEADDLERLTRRARGGVWANTALAAVEGGGLGLLGCGLPDIPLFLTALLKNVCEIARRYEFPNEGKGERIYILTLLGSALAPPEEQETRNRAVDDVAERLEMGLALHEDEGKTLTAAAQALARAMLVSKFIQGYPLIGIAGGVANSVIMRKIGDYALLKYKKRFLLRLRRAKGTKTGNGAEGK